MSIKLPPQRLCPVPTNICTKIQTSPSLLTAVPGPLPPSSLVLSSPFYTRLFLQSHFFFISFSSTQLFPSPCKHVIIIRILKENTLFLSYYLQLTPLLCSPLQSSVSCTLPPQFLSPFSLLLQSAFCLHYFTETAELDVTKDLHVAKSSGQFCTSLILKWPPGTRVSALFPPHWFLLFTFFVWVPPHPPNFSHWSIPGLGSRTLVLFISPHSLGDLIESHAFKDHLEAHDSV